MNMQPQRQHLDPPDDLRAMFAAAFPAPKRATPHPLAREGEKRARKRRAANNAEFSRLARKVDWEARAIQYATWLAERDGHKVPVWSYAEHGNDKINVSVNWQWVTHPDGKTRRHSYQVVWYLVTTRRLPKARRRGYQWQRDETLTETLLTIQIPHWDFVPTVIDLSEPE